MPRTLAEDSLLRPRLYGALPIIQAFSPSMTDSPVLTPLISIMILGNEWLS